MSDVDHKARAIALFSTLNPKTGRLTARESSTIEFKQNFNWGNRSAYAKSMAAFANNRGGYLIFGISDSPRQLVGLTSSNFESLDEATITAYLGSLFSPEVQYEKFVWVKGKRRIGVIHTAKAEDAPVVAIKNDNDIKEAEIYYRYNARNDKAKYPEIRALLEQVRVRERQGWVDLLERIGRIGPNNAGVMSLATGIIEGSGQSLLIDAKLLRKLHFIREGTLAPKGQPVLKLIGDVRPIAMGAAPISGDRFRLTNDPAAPVVREESILATYPLTYADLRRRLRAECHGFKEDARFHRIKNQLRKNQALVKIRLLDPKNPRGGSKAFYSEQMVPEVCKLYAIAIKK